MTKKIFLVGSLLAIAGMWTGCSNDILVENPSNQQEISFRVQGGTPALRATGTTLPYVDAFIVNAYGNNTGSTATMSAVTVYRKEGATVNNFDYNPKAYYFTADTEVGFAAYSPVSTNVSQGFGYYGSDNKIDYTVPVPDATSGTTQQEDLLVAYTNQTDLSGPAVALNFKHALSRVYVTAENLLNNDVIIQSIQLGNLYESGTLDIDADVWRTAGAVDINEAYVATPSALANYKILWTPSGTDTQTHTYSYVLPESGVAVPTNTSKPTYVVSVEQGMLILPQTTQLTNGSTFDFDDSKDFYVQIEYTVGNLNETIKVPFADLYGLNNGLSFEFGRQYALNVTFSAPVTGHIEINFDVRVEDWGSMNYFDSSTIVLSFDLNGLNGTAPGFIVKSYDTSLPGASFTIPDVPADNDDAAGTLEWNTRSNGSGTPYNGGEVVTFTVDTKLYLFDRQP